MLTNDQDDNSSLVVDIFLLLAIKLYPKLPYNPCLPDAMLQNWNWCNIN